MEKIPEQQRLVASLMALARREEGIKDFWQQYMHHVASLCSAQQALLVAQAAGQWQVLSFWPTFLPAIPFNSTLKQLAATAQAEEVATTQAAEKTVLALRIDVGPQEISPVLLLDLGSTSPLPPATSTLLLIAAIPSVFQVTRQYRQARADIVFFAEMMKLVGAITEDAAFGLAAMRLCNETATLLQCSQVSLGWDRGQGMHIQAISHLDEFEQSAGVVRDLEAVMDECADQDSEILWPMGAAKTQFITRSHEFYVGERKIGAILTLPLRRDQQVVGALCCERLQQPFSEEEIWRLRLLLEQCSRWLSILEERTLWFGGRLWRRMHAWCARQISFEHAGWKLATVAGLLAGVLLFVDLWPHAVQGTFLLKADEAVHISSPIDGYLKTALVEPGDLVNPGDRLIEFDGRELLTEQSATLARLARYYREAEKAKASNALAEMRIALLMAKETEAELERIAFSLANTRITAPFKGVVAEGDLRARIGAPVRKGDLLLKIASLEQLSVKLTLAENEIVDIATGMEATLTFVGRPDSRYQARLSKIVPNATVEGAHNVFTVYAALQGQPEGWWRPGMSGMVEIRLGRRSLWWLLSHDVLDFMRLKFWI
jgi:multidrug resistance efflux pump